MRATSSDAPRRAAHGLLAAVVACLASACSWRSAPEFPRPPLPLPDAVRERYALPAPPVRVDEHVPDHNGILDGELLFAGERVVFHLHRAAGTAHGLVLLVPILAGGEQLMRTLACRMTERGFHVAWCNRVASALSPPQRAPELETLFRRTVLHQRALLAWLLEQDGYASLPVFAFGVSMGGMVSTVLAAVEPRVAASAICLAGADLPRIVLETSESRVQRWLHWREETDAIGRSTLQQELERYLTSDPLHLAPYVAAERVLFVSAGLDTVVPAAPQDLLWEALGRPCRFTVPFGHYSAALVLDAIVDTVAEFFLRACA